MLLEEIYRKANVVWSGKSLTTVNEFTDQIPALRPEVLMEVAHKVIKVMSHDISKIVTEEDKGVALATTISLLTGIPLAIARWYSYSLGGLNEQVVVIESEYFQGQLYLNGVEVGDRVIIIDDTLSSGGAVIALVEAVKAAGGELVDIVCAVEKVGNGGADNVKRATGLTVKTIMKVTVSEGGVSIE
ncbi:phosphoribosyltransferase family protein [Pseudomonas sp. R5-89-07]|uniref:phosphoribosyltransferase family protein n=1 Tax=Pseudomonas sp. R5-89-07 TaxID=658644 RepID=UPI000F58EF52|nr:phosphoribosyltransferase family protein [Pseudomonas sp. R5-89-07]AZF06263.1 Adenine phosphoribosyltransferase [Pseudomonas sp. R5-89-07]